MKFSCDACGAQYMIADEKVGERGVKVKCKKCEHMIIVRPRADDDAPSAGQESSPDSAFGPSAATFDGGFAQGGDDDLAGEKTIVSAAPSFSGTDVGASGGAFGAGDDFGAGNDTIITTGLGAFGAQSTDVSTGTQPTEPAPSAPQGGDQMSGAFDSLFGAAGAAGGAGLAGAAADVAPGDAALGESLEPSSGAPSSTDSAAGEKEWYVAVDDSQVGPIDLAEVEQRWDAREIHEDSLAWKAGMDDWSPISEIPELSYLVTERPQGGAASSFASAAAPGGISAGVSAGAVGAGAGATSVGAAAPSAAALSPVAFGGGAPASDVAWKPSAASALSSLVQEELVSEPEPPPSHAPAPLPEGLPSLGGGADIFGGAPGNGAGIVPASFGAPSDGFASAAPGFAIPAPVVSSGPSKLVYVLLGFMSLLILAAVGLLTWKLVLAPPAPTVAQGSAPADSPAVAQQGGLQPSGAAPAPRPKDTAPPSAQDEDAGAKGKGKGASKKKDKEKDTKTVAQGAGKGKKGGGKKGDDLDDVFESSEPRKPAKDKLTVQDIMNVVKKNAGSVAPCLKNARDKGEIVPNTYTFKLDWTIEPNGSVSGARLTGPSNLLGTSLPACFARTMSRWKFPPSRQAAPVKNFPFGPINVK